MNEPWMLTLHNLSKGWELSTWAGEQVPQLTDANPIQLQDGAKFTWGFSDYPAGFEPRQATYAIRALTAAHLSTVDTDPGDAGSVMLTHSYVDPIRGPEVKTWFAMSGYFDEPEVKQDGRGLVMELALSDPLAALAGTPVDDPLVWPNESLGTRLARIAQAAGINIISRSEYAGVATMGQVTVNNKGALPLLRECLDGCLYQGEQLVLRGGLQGHELVDTSQMDVVYEGAPPWSTYGAPIFWLDKVGKKSTMAAPYVLTVAHDLGAPGAPAGVGLRVAQREPVAQLHEVNGGAALDAGDVLRDATTWKKAVDGAVNTVKLVGLDAAGEEKSVVASWPDLVKAHGPVTRVVQTQRYMGGPSPIADAAALLPERDAAVPGWTADTFTFTTRNLTGEEVTGYAAKFYPGGYPGLLASMQKPVAIVGVDTTAALTGGDLSGVLTGAVMQLSKGVLTITGTLRNELLRPSGAKTNLVTWADLRSEVVHNEPALSWSAFTWHSNDATPHTGSDVTFDAEQAHPSFNHEQLSWRDLRLIGVDA